MGILVSGYKKVFGFYTNEAVNKYLVVKMTTGQILAPLLLFRLGLPLV